MVNNSNFTLDLSNNSLYNCEKDQKEKYNKKQDFNLFNNYCCNFSYMFFDKYFNNFKCN